MQINKSADLGKAFETLKKDLLNIEGELQSKSKTGADYGQNYAHAYGRLTAVVQYHICINTDVSFTDLGSEMRIAGTSIDDIPEELFTATNGHGGLAD